MYFSRLYSAPAFFTSSGARVRVQLATYPQVVKSCQAIIDYTRPLTVVGYFATLAIKSR